MSDFKATAPASVKLKRVFFRDGCSPQVDGRFVLTIQASMVRNLRLEGQFICYEDFLDGETSHVVPVINARDIALLNDGPAATNR